MKQLATVLATTGIALSPSQLGAAEPQGLQAALANALDHVNAQFAAAGSTRQYLKIEALLAEDAYLSGDAQPVSAHVIAKDVGNKQLIGLNGPEHFVPRDLRRLPWSAAGDTDGRDSITYSSTHWLGASWPFSFSAVQEQVIAKAMSAWDTVDCAELPIVDSDQPVTFLLPLPPGADVEHAGVLPFSGLGIPPQAGVIALTLSAYFEDPPGVLTDIDGNGRADVMSRAIIYNGELLPYVDFPTVVRHEAGHGLSQGHFGNVWLDESGLRAAPKATMNAAYTGPQRLLSGVDIGGHCSIWASWPHR